jgi:hypothetical protein
MAKRVSPDPVQPKRQRARAARPTHLVLIAGADGLRLFSAHHDADNAAAVVAQMEALLAATGHSVTVVEVPNAAGIASLPTIPLKPIPALTSLLPLPTARAAIQQPATKFRRQSADEFEQETLAMMNGEIPMDGIQWRDADAPISEGGAVS